MVGETEQSPRKGLIRIVAAGPSIVVGSAVAAADSTDRDMSMAVGQSSLRRCIGSLRIAWRIKMKGRMGREWGRGGRAGEKDGQIEGVE
jgi:hypothetical protein